jgi:hypothetical protein
VIITFVIFGLLSAAAVGISVWAGVVLFRERRPSAYARDREHVTEGVVCVRCGGYATRLEHVQGVGFMCKNRALCRETVIYKHMLDSA